MKKQSQKEFQEEIAKFLSERYEVTLPLYAIKILLKQCVSEGRYYDNMGHSGFIIGPFDGIYFNAKKQLVYIIAEELKKCGLDWKSIFKEVLTEVNENETDDIPF